MAVPDFQSFMLPVLRLAANGHLNTIETIARISDYFGLSDEDRQERLAKGRQTRVANRVYWALIHLAKADLLHRESRGFYSITEKGQQILAENPQRIDVKFLMAHSKNYCQFRNATTSSVIDNEADVSSVALAISEKDTPEERIETAFAEFNATLQSELQERMQTMSDADFERLIVKLMIGLGYGEGRRVGRAGDGGVDGIITQDVLGLDVIYLQAKRYKLDSAIGPEKIREFAGAMDTSGISKGVFVTTSRYTDAARKEAKRSHKRLRLIDGNELAELMVQHDIGVRRDRVLELKRLDADFFDDLGE